MTDLKLNIHKRERLADQLYGQILQQIVTGELSEGDKLPSENDIANSFQVSRPVIREALQRLQADGLVYSRQGSGSFVKARPPEGLIQFAKPSDVASLLRCFEARLPLEGSIASMAAQRATSEELHAIELALVELEEAMDKGEGAAQADYAFHMAIAKASGNEFFISILASLNSAIMSGIQVATNITRKGSPERTKKVREEHRAIVDAISTGDGEAADLSMRYHIHSARTRVTNYQRDK